MVARPMNHSARTKKSIRIAGLLLLLLMLVFPFDLTIAPERSFKVVEENGAPIHRIQVTQIWDQYSLEYRDEERKLTGPDGHVLLPRRKVRTSGYDLIVGAAGKILEYTIHASICSSDTVLISAFGYESQYFFDGEGLGDTVVLKRQ
jgi:hypothetical protein